MTKLKTPISDAKISEDDLKNWQTIPIEKVNSIKDKLNIPHDLEVGMIDMNLCMNLLFGQMINAVKQFPLIILI